MDKKQSMSETCIAQKHRPVTTFTIAQILIKVILLHDKNTILQWVCDPPASSVHKQAYKQH
jgi:hypothetical protein